VTYEDKDAATGTDGIQLPDMAGVTVPGLANGSWAVRAEDWLLIAPGLSGSEINLEDIQRLTVNYARSKPAAHIVQ